MKTLEKGNEKIQKICDALRKETLEPARQEGEKIIEEARAKAQAIIHEARKEAEQAMRSAKEKARQEREVLRSSMVQATKQSLEALRQDIEHRIFNDEMDILLKKRMKDTDLVVRLIKAVIDALEKEGLAANLIAMIPQEVSAEEVNGLLGEGILKRLEGGSVVVGTFRGGAEVKVKDKKMTIEITDEAIKDLLARYVRKDFRELIFNV